MFSAADSTEIILDLENVRAKGRINIGRIGSSGGESRVSVNGLRELIHLNRAYNPSNEGTKMKMGVPAAALRNPEDSAERTLNCEDAALYDGSECGAAIVSRDGEWELLRSHWHLVVKDKSPDAGPRRCPVWA